MYCPKCQQIQSEIYTICPQCGRLLVDNTHYEKAKRENVKLLPIKPEFLLKKREIYKTFEILGIILLCIVILMVLSFIFIHPITTIFTGIIALSEAYLFYATNKSNFIDTLNQSKFIYQKSVSPENQYSKIGNASYICLVIAGVCLALVLDLFAFCLGNFGEKIIDNNLCWNCFWILALLTIILYGIGMFLGSIDKGVPNIKNSEEIQIELPKVAEVIEDWRNSYVRCPYCNSYNVKFIKKTPLKKYGKRWTCENCKHDF